MKFNKLACAFLAAGFLAPTLASATNGYFQHGYGVKNSGRAGVSTAYTEDAFGGANNPAQMVWVGQRLDVGLNWFRPIREASRIGSPAGANFSEESDNEDFFIPEFGYNMMINPNLSLGVSVYGNGGMNTTYESGVSTDCSALFGAPPGSVRLNPLCGVGALGVNLSQLIIAPTLAWKFHPQHSIGVSPLIGYQRFKSYGLQPFAQISTFLPSVATNPGTDDSWGFGVRVGWLGKFDRVSVGASYASKIYMDEFDKYRGLFAEQGDFDIPANLNLGIKVDVTPALTVGFDYQYIWYNDVDSIANSSVSPLCAQQLGGGTPAPLATGCLGGSQGIGFAWDNVEVYKFAVEYQVNEKWRLRAGYSTGDNPIPSSDVTFNILAPGVIEEHLSLGFTYTINPSSEVSVAYTHAFENEVSGPTNPVYFPVGGTETLRMHQDALGIAYSMKW
jgi:long-chain fatty acid transport protein